MDMSKLPKLSKTPAPPVDEAAPSPNAAPAPVAPAAAQPQRVEPLRPAPASAEAWLSLIVGLILIFLFRTPLDYATSRSNPAAFEQAHSYTDVNGSAIGYTHTGFFWADLSMLVFAVALLLDGIVLLVPRRQLILAVLVLMGASVMFNLYVIFRVQPLIGFQMYNALAIAFGGYIALSQLRLLRGT